MEAQRYICPKLTEPSSDSQIPHHHEEKEVTCTIKTRKHEKQYASAHQLEKSASPVPARSIGGAESMYRERYHHKHHKKGRHSYRHETKFSGRDTSSEEGSYMDRERTFF